ncbi:hypothetical protein F0P96_05060 [Hymenobacter busanensis]|uniref:Uncharacterized protein n=1 Tax=Hymenobacter busanensis TaxID=2607656 RepID=A0A7L5A1G1_9BACT|nr:hypothetical protein F0P96_05060 [Hymenobacter busanensis]QHJ09358.1 hypothetical protein GUY19_19550 [Hymenobacter busanensis]
MAPLLLAVGLLLFPAARLQAQTVTAGPDSARVATSSKAVADSLRRTERLFGLRMTRPTKAAVLAMVLPGAGQVYNHKYWKLPLVYGALGLTVYGEVFYYGRYLEFKKGYEIRQRRVLLKDPTLLDTGPNSGQYTNTTEGDATQQRVFYAYRNRRDVFFAYIGLAYGLQIVDALVDGHLHDFDISEDLSLNCRPHLMLPGVGLPPTAGMALTFTLHPPKPAGARR